MFFERVITLTNLSLNKMQFILKLLNLIDFQLRLWLTPMLQTSLNTSKRLFLFLVKFCSSLVKVKAQKQIILNKNNQLFVDFQGQMCQINQKKKASILLSSLHLLQAFSNLFQQYQIRKYLMHSNLNPQIHRISILDHQISSSAKNGFKRKRIFSKNRKQYYWNDFQQKRYINFVKDSFALLQLSIQEKKELKVNKLMSQKVKSRTPAQCHTHHQKMLQKYQSIPDILQHHLYLFNELQSQEIKNIIKVNFGVKKSLDQMLQYSKRLVFEANQLMVLQNSFRSQGQFQSERIVPSRNHKNLMPSGMDWMNNAYLDVSDLSSVNWELQQ